MDQSNVSSGSSRVASASAYARARWWARFRVGALLFTGACGLYGVDPPGQKPLPEISQVVLKITSLPDDVKCLRITAAGAGRTEAREIDVAGGTDVLENLSGLPLGMVTFTGEAFAAACSAVSKATVAGWASEPVVASIVLGRVANVTLAMTRNGRAHVDVTFNDEAACTATGGACRLASECCTRHCLDHACVVADAGN